MVPTQDTPKEISTISKSQTWLNIRVTWRACPKSPWSGSFKPTLRDLDSVGLCSGSVVCILSWILLEHVVFPLSVMTQNFK